MEITCYLLRCPIGNKSLMKNGIPASLGYLNSEKSQQITKITQGCFKMSFKRQISN